MGRQEYIQDFHFNADLLRGLLWQYNDAESLQVMLRKKQEWYERNQAEFWNWWIVNVFDLRTASNFGLAVWGKILGESRGAPVKGMDADYPAFGFGRHRRNFGRGNFRRSSDGYIRLGGEQYRLLLQLRYFKLVSQGTVPEINTFLKRLFQGQGKAHVLDPLDMSFAVYVFTFAPSSWQRFVLEDMDALPRPAGVGACIRVVSKPTFGFGEHHSNFGSTFAESKKD